jgi:hypothetical protein
MDYRVKPDNDGNFYRGLFNRLKKRTIGKMAGVAGFEPARGDIKNRCLTAWLHPNDLCIPYLVCLIKKRKFFLKKLTNTSYPLQYYMPE